MTIKHVLAALALLAPALAVVGSSGAEGPQRLAKPTEATPWPMYGQGPDRTRVAPTSADVGINVLGYERIWQVSGHVGTDGNLHYSGVAVGDLDVDGELEIVTTTSKTLGGGGGLVVVDRAGEVLWTDLNVTGDVGYPVVLQADEDPELEVFVSHSREHTLWDHTGERVWTTETKKFAGGTTSHALPVDVDGDGSMEILQATEVEPRWMRGPIERHQNQTPTLHLFDGETGEVLASRGFPCGIFVTQLVGHQADEDIPTVLAGTVYFLPSDDIGEPCSRLMAFQIEERSDGLLDTVTTTLGLATPYRITLQWSHTIRNDTVHLGNPILGDFAPAAGDEILVPWSTHRDDADSFSGGERDTPLGLTVLGIDGRAMATYETERNSPPPTNHVATDLKGGPLDEVVTEFGDGYAAFAPRPWGLEPVWRIPATDVNGTIKEENGGVAAANLDGQGRPEVVLGWDYGEVGSGETGAVEIRSADGEQVWIHNLTQTEGLDVPIRNGRMVDLGSDGDIEILYPVGARLNLYAVRGVADG